MSAGAGGAPQSILFVCTLNSVRSPIAEGLARARFGRKVFIDSAGLQKTERNGFAIAVLREVGIDFAEDEPRGLDEIDCESFDLVIALSPEAHERVKAQLRATAAELLFWPIEDPTMAGGTREARMEAFRLVRDTLDRKIRAEIGARLGLRGEAGA